MACNVPLQILRAIAAAIVVYEHSITTYGEKVTIDGSVVGYNIGGIGVEIFFAISGYIIYKSTQNIAPSFNSSMNFVARRLIRVFPIYVVATVIYSVKLYFEGVPPTQDAIAYSFLFYPYIDGSNGLMRPVLGVGWSLNYEIFFYATLAFAILFNKASRVGVVIGLISIFLLYGFIESPSRAQDSSGYTLLATSWMFYFLLGLVMAHFSSFLRVKSIRLKTLGIVSALGAVVFTYVCFSASLDTTAFLGTVTGLLVSFLCILLCINAPTEEEETDGKVIYWLTKAGDGSYSTYLFHSFILGVSGRLLSKLEFINISQDQFAVIMVIVTASAGIVIYDLVESPVTKIAKAGTMTLVK